MVLILSESRDMTTYYVAKWIEAFGKKVFIATEKSHTEIVRIENACVVIKIDEVLIDLDDVSAFWFRRGNFFFDRNTAEIPHGVANDSRNEYSLIIEILYSKLSRKRKLGDFYQSDLNRVLVLESAKEEDLSIPDFGIFGDKKALEKFHSRYQNILVKPIGNGPFIIEDNVLYSTYSELFSKSDIEQLPDTFHPTLFLEYVDKKYEVRIFYLNGAFFSMAILSQADTQTSIDFRKYNVGNPNRNVPYTLPSSVCEKIDRLMKKIGLETGSIDMIVTKEDEFVFLEINPIGQFLNVSHHCGYGLEMRIAKYLCGHD